MIKLQLTKKFQDKSGLKINSDSDVPLERIYSWHVHSFPRGRRTGVILMNDLTRYSVILFGLQKADYKNLFSLFVEQLRRNMETDGYSKQETENYISNFDEFVLSKTSDKSVMGSIKNSILDMPYWLDLSGFWDEDKITYINSKFNDTPILALERYGLDAFPKDGMKKVLTGNFDR